MPTCDRLFILSKNQLQPISDFTVTSRITGNEKIKIDFIGATKGIELRKTYEIENTKLTVTYHVRSEIKDSFLIIEDSWGINKLKEKDFPEKLQAHKTYDIIDSDYDIRIRNSISANALLEITPRFSVSQEVDYFVQQLQQLRLRLKIPLNSHEIHFMRTLEITERNI